MPKSSGIEKLKADFAKTVQETSLQYLPVNLADGIVHAFFIEVTDTVKLQATWRIVSNFIALHFQNSLQDDFQVWNVYLFFRVYTPVSNELKYTIENDTFSSRKIIIEDAKTDTEITEEHILNSDLHINQKKDKDLFFVYNPVLWKFLKEKNPKKIVTEEDKKLFNKIIAKIKSGDEDKKS